MTTTLYVLCQDVLTVCKIITFKNLKSLSNKITITNSYLPKCSKFNIKDNFCMGERLFFLSSITRRVKSTLVTTVHGGEMMEMGTYFVRQTTLNKLSQTCP